MISHIFFDLDNCLCDFQYHVSNSRTKIVLSEGEKYYGILRPLAHRMLQEASRIAPVLMLTTSRREYAFAVNKVFDLGFEHNEIFAFEDCWQEIQSAYGYDIDYFPCLKDIAPNSILIDNLPVTDQWPRRKMQVLGIKEERYFQIREFKGQDPAKFKLEWGQMMDKIWEIAEDE